MLTSELSQGLTFDGSTLSVNVTGLERQDAALTTAIADRQYACLYPVSLVLYLIFLVLVWSYPALLSVPVSVYFLVPVSFVLYLIFLVLVWSYPALLCIPVPLYFLVPCLSCLVPDTLSLGLILSCSVVCHFVSLFSCTLSLLSCTWYS